MVRIGLSIFFAKKFNVFPKKVDLEIECLLSQLIALYR